jgi:Protein of unknown function (DUF3570)
MQLTSAPRRRQKYDTRFRFGLATMAILVAPCLAPSGAWGRRGARPAIELEADANDGARDDDESEAKAEADAKEEDDEELIRRPRRRRKPKPRSMGGGPSVRASTEVSAYTDSDAVHVLSPTVSGAVADDVAGWSIGGSYLVDAVSAASVDIVSTASGHWVERRHVGAGSANFKAGPVAVALSGGFSREPDYSSLGGGGVISFELAEKNVMPFIGGSYGHDLVGRTGDPMDAWPALNKVSIKTGVTFVVNRSTIASLSFDEIIERGYLAKPYRYLPVVAPGVSAQVPPGASVDLVKSLNEYSVAENVPSQRNRSALAGRLAYRSGIATFRGDQRLYYDNWGLLATTTDVHEYVDLGSRVVVWPHLRAHLQRGVFFWRRIVEQIPNPVGPAGIPTYRAGDRELGPLYTLTGGFGIKIRLNADLKAPMTLNFQLDGIYTRYLDAVYISERRAMFGALGLEAVF